MLTRSRLAALGAFSRRVLVTLWAVLLVAFAPSTAWAGSDDAAATTSPPSSSSSTGVQPVDLVETSSSTSEPSPTSAEPSSPDETEDSAVVSIDSDQWSQLLSLGWGVVVGLVVLVLVASAGVIASFGRGNHVS